MARVCTICTHPDRHAIERAMVDGLTVRAIAGQYAIGRDAVQRHKTSHLARELANPEPVAIGQPIPTHPDSGAIARYAAREPALEQAHAVDLFAELYLQLQRLGKTYDALDRWLSDPDDPERYTIEPRAEEIQVVYYDLHDMSASGAPRKKRSRLSHLLQQVREDSRGMVDPVSGETKWADPRKLLVEVSAELRQQMALRAQLLERLHGVEEEEAFRRIVLDAIEEAAPDVRARIADRLRSLRPR